MPKTKIGPILWMLSFQYLITQMIVAAAWDAPFSLLKNTISDLGNTACGDYGERYVCSPLHPLMNASFILLGITMVFGALLIYRHFRHSTGSKLGFGFMALSGLGTVMVGLFPENSMGQFHFLGALLTFLIGNVGVAMLGIALKLPTWLRIYSVLSGAVSLVALMLFVTHNYLGLGIGGMERIAAYPQTIWLVTFGLYSYRNGRSLAK